MAPETGGEPGVLRAQLPRGGAPAPVLTESRALGSGECPPLRDLVGPARTCWIRSWGRGAQPPVGTGPRGGGSLLLGTVTLQDTRGKGPMAGGAAKRGI